MMCAQRDRKDATVLRDVTPEGLLDSRRQRVQTLGSFDLSVRFWASAKFILLKKKKGGRGKKQNRVDERPRECTAYGKGKYCVLKVLFDFRIV